MSEKFWSDSSLEPRRNFKFLLTIGTGDKQIPTWVVKNVTLPKITVEEGTHKFLNHTFYFPGTVSYNTVSFTVIDAIDKSVSKRILESFVQGGYQIPSAESNVETSLITKSDSVSSLGTVSISHLGSGKDGYDKELSFDLTNAWIKDLEFPQGLSYDSQDPSEIKVELRYDFFEFKSDAVKLPGFGSTIAGQYKGDK